MKILKFLPFLLFCFVLSCGDDDMPPPTTGTDGDLTDIPYEPVDYNIEAPCGFPEMEIPADNPLTEAGIKLGRFLFYDPILSADSTMSCGGCHNTAGSFTDNLAVSTGIDGVAGTRSSMSLLNVGYFYTGLFWDGRATTLEEQALLPVEDVIELHNTWPNVVDKLKNHGDYPTLFREAFGISNKSEITKTLSAKAIAQFERTLVSSGQSKFDRVRCEPGVFFTAEELEGFELFVNEDGEHPGCTHCHKTVGHMFTDDEYHNNGIDSVGLGDDNLVNFSDLGLGAVTNNVFDNGKFRTPSLNNIALTGPYMHDGRFNTLEEVIDHYSTGGKPSPNLNANILPFPLTADEKSSLLAFLNTLTDTEFTNNPAHQNPFD